MNETNITAAANGVTDFTWLFQLAPPALIFVFVAVLGYFVRRMVAINNRWLWPVCVVVGTGLYAMVGARANADAWTNVGLKLIYGVLLSIFGAGAALTAHNKVFVFLARQWPVLGLLVSEDTDIPAKSPPPSTPAGVDTPH